MREPVTAALRHGASGVARGFHGRSAGSRKALGCNGFRGVGNSASTLGQLWGNSASTLRQGSACLFRGMEHAASIDHGRDLVVRDVFVGFAGFWWPGHSTEVAGPPNSHDTPVPRIQPLCRISPDLVGGEPTEPIRSATTPTYCDQHESDERVQAQTCPCATDLVVRPTHLQRAAHPRPDRVRCWFREDRRVHTCGPEPGGGLS